MKIDRKSWHYKLYRIWFEERESENLCGYFWKNVLSLLATVTLAPIIFILLGCIFGAAWFIGFWPNEGKYKEKPASDIVHRQYKFDGRRKWPVAPWEIVIPLAILYGIVMVALRNMNAFLETITWVGIVIGALAVLAGLGFLIFKGWKSETFKLVRAYLSARKQKVCPLIEFEGKKPK